MRKGGRARGRPDSSVSGAVAFGLAMDGCADLTAPQHANSGWGRMKLESYLNENQRHYHRIGCRYLRI